MIHCKNITLMINYGNSSNISSNLFNHTVLHIYNVYKYTGYREYGNNIQYNQKVSIFYHKFGQVYRIVCNSFCRIFKWFNYFIFMLKKSMVSWGYIISFWVWIPVIIVNKSCWPKGKASDYVHQDIIYITFHYRERYMNILL